MKLRVSVAIIAALALLLPPPVQADSQCFLYLNYELEFWTSCWCYACTGWSPRDCAECWDPQTGSFCQSDISPACNPHPVNQH